ncbi:MAG: hypothetical protein M0P14_08100 [Alkaliphilus sp.]|nr:hypothetical protein [Alkaliphilus sp.]
MIFIAKTDLTLNLEKMIWEHTKKHMGLFGCYEVTIGWYGEERVDYITYDTKGIFRCYEIKVSKPDFYSNAKLSFVGHYNYFVMPYKLFDEVKNEIPKHIGVYGAGRYGLTSEKRAYKQNDVDVDILKDSMIRSLYREYERIIESDNPSVVERLRKKAGRLKNEKDKISEKYNELQNKFIYKYGFDEYEKLIGD